MIVKNTYELPLSDFYCLLSNHTHRRLLLVIPAVELDQKRVIWVLIGFNRCLALSQLEVKCQQSYFLFGMSGKATIYCMAN
jgi:hypothetical protein